MNFNDLSIFHAIYESGSINKAAKKLGYAQSNITTRLQEMEKELHTPLFLRTSSGVIPTTEGNLFYTAVLNIEKEFTNVTNQIKHQKKSLLGSEVLVSDLVNHNLIDYDAFSKIIVKKQNDIIQESTKHLYNIVVTFSDLNNQSNYSLQKVCTIYCNYLAHHETDFENKNLPILINSDPECEFRKKTLLNVTNDNRVLEIDSLQTITQMVAQGQGIAFLPVSLANKKDFTKLQGTDIPLNYHLYRAKQG